MHGNCHALDQLVFALNVALTLQGVKIENESENIKNYIARMKGQEARTTMTKLEKCRTELVE